MNIADILLRDAVLPDLQADTRDAVLEELSAPLYRLYPELEGVDLLRILRERENMGSTAMGDGVAIPHGKIAGLSSIAFAAGRSRKGVDFGAPDKELCHIFFLILTPERGAGQHLRLLAQIARRAKEPSFRSEVMLAESPAQLWQTLTAP